MRLSPALLFGLALLAPALLHAGDRTRTPARLRGDVELRYVGELGFTRLVDRTNLEVGRLEVGRSTRQQHGMALSGMFAPYHGLAVGLQLPVTMHDRRVWGDANDMRFDPDTGAPTMVGGSELSAEVLASSVSSRNHVGFGDLRLLVRGVAFAQEGVPGRTAPATLSFDVALRLPTGGNHDRVRENGTAGPGVGGAGLQLGMTAARRLEGLEPYLVLAYTVDGPYKQALLDAGGTAVPAPVGATDPTPDPEGRWTLDPADRFDLRLGVEILATQNLPADTEVRFDVGAGLGYVGPGDVSVGRYLPAPLASTVGHRAVHGEHLVADMGIGLRIRPVQYVEVRIDAGGAWNGPRSVERIGERVYSVETAPDAFAVRWAVAVRGRIR